MASRNTSLSSKSSDYSEIDDLPIVPPQPVPQKECKEIVPDISTVSDIVDNGSPLLPTPNNFLHANINRTSYQQRGNKSCISKTGMDITEITNAILDRNAGLPVMTYLNPGCQSCIINHAVMTNKGYNGQYALPKTSASILLPVGNEQSDKEMRFKSVDGEVNSNKTCHKHIELNVTASSNRKSIACNHAQLSCPLNSNEPERFQTEDIPNHCCSKDQHSKLRKSLSKYERPVSSDSRLGESRKSEETCEKETVDKNKLKDMHIMCPACFRKPCTCNFSAKEYNANPHASSDALSSIWEYLKQQDEKIDSINEKVLNFLSQHASCLIDQPSQGNEFSNATESDIPYILNILEVHGDKIREIQDQINLLKSSEHISSPTNNNKIDESILNQAQTINCVNTETCKEEIHCPHSHNAVCCEQKQKITKTSTSTMTSLVIETNDKFVYHKQKTVVTGMREKKESSCLPNEHDSPTMKKHLDGENVNSNSQKRKSHKLNNCSPSLKCKQNLSSNSSSDVPDPNDNQVFKTSLKSEKKSKRASTRNKVVDKKNVNVRAMKDNDVEEKNNSPALKTAALKSNSRSSKEKLRNSTSPKIVDTATVRDLGNKKMTRQISASSSSSDTEYSRTKQRPKVFDKTELDSEETETYSEESTTVSKYGLSSKNLSKATKRYLDTYGLRRTRRLSNQYDT